ncbi:MAG: lipid II flippase MurJ [Candidatus Zixiibacteriota bacterium]
MAVSVKRAVAGMSLINVGAMLGAAAQAIVVARAFGTDRAYDLFLLIAVLPELLTVFTQNLFAALVLPLFHKLQAGGDERGAWRSLWNVFNLSFLFYVGVSAAIFLLARPLAAWLVADASPAELSYAANLLRVYAPAVALSLVLRNFLSFHNALESFVFPALTNLVPPLFIVTSVLLFAGAVGPFAIAAGAVAAAATQIIILTTRVITKGFRHWRPTLDFRDPAVRLFFGWAAPLAFGAAAEQIQTFIDRQVAATLELSGAVSALKYGFTLTAFTIAFFSVPLARVTFTYFSRDAARADRDEINTRFNRVLRQLVIFYVPASVGLILLAEPLIRFLFMGGKFDEASLALARPAVAAYAAGIFFLVAANLVRYVAYAYKRYLGYSLIAVAAVAATYGLDRAFAGLWGHWGIALARGAVALLWGAAVFAFLARAEGLRVRGKVFGTAIRSLLAAGPMAALVWWMSNLSWGIGGHPRVEPFVVAVASAAAGGALYFLLLFVLREEVVVELAGSAWKKLFKK